MDGCCISQAAQCAGLPATTLRYCEGAGLVRPGRTPAGHRRCDESSIEQLALIGRAKGFGRSLEGITELLGLLDEDRCAPVQGRSA